MKKSSFSFQFNPLTKNFLFTYQVALISIALCGILFIKLSLDYERESIRRKISDAAIQSSKIVTYDVDYVKYQLFYVGRQISVMNGDKEKIYKALSAFVTNINNQVDVALTWNAFSWIDDQNKLSVDGTSGILSRAIDLSERDYIQQTRLTSEKIIFGKPIYGALSQRYLIPAGLGIFSARGVYLGTLVFGLDIEKINLKLSKTISNDAISFAFLQNGNFVFGSENFDNSNLSIIQSLSEKSESQRQALDKTNISSQSLFSQSGSEAYFHQLKNYPLEIISFYDKDAYREQLFNVLLRKTFIVLLIVFCFIFLFRNIRQKIINPLSEISLMAKKTLAKDFTYEVKNSDFKEMQDLFDAIILLRNSYKREQELLCQLKLANQKIAQENFNKSEFLSAISHDIRNPLSAIISFSHLIQDQNKDLAIDQENVSKDIEICAMDALQFINDLMDVSQISSGEFSVDMSHKIDISEIIMRSVRVNRDFARKRNIEINTDIENNIPYVNLDQRRIKQILVNLISNSVKYSKDGTKINIIAKSVNINGRAKLEIIIKDQGFGMTNEQLKKAMERFGVVENENSGKIDSFGLGLPLVRRLVELQLGEMNIESEVSVGTKIVLTFNY